MSIEDKKTAQVDRFKEIAAEKQIRGQRRWLNSRETSEYLDKSLYTLQRWRSKGIGPRWGKNGHTVIYFIDDLDEHLESTLVPAGVAPDAPDAPSSADPNWFRK